MNSQLNPQQHRWLRSFLENHPYYKVKQIWSDLDGDRVVRLEGLERLPLPVIPEFENAIPGYHWHSLQLKLRKYGDLRVSATHKYETVYPHCDIDSISTTSQLLGQLEFSIPQALNIAATENPAVCRWKPKQKAKRKTGVQLSLPVTGMEAELYKLRQQTRPYLPPVSSQELLGEKLQTWSLRDSRSVEVPQVLLDLLRKHCASEDESQNAIDLFEVAGLSCSLIYVEALPNWRKRDGTTVSTVAASLAVERATIKPTTVPLQVKAHN